MWVATDLDGRQRLFQGSKPWRDAYEEERTLTRWNNWNYTLTLEPKIFSNQTFCDEPIEIVLLDKDKLQNECGWCEHYVDLVEKVK